MVAAGCGAHPIERGEQIHGCGPACCEIIAYFIHFATGLNANANAVRRGNADGRCAAHAQLLDGLPHIFHRAAVEIHCFRRQSRLIEQHEVAAGVTMPAKCFEVLCHGKGSIFPGGCMLAARLNASSNSA